MAVGPFTAPGAAGVTAASQTDLDCRYVHVAADVIDYIATRAGTIVGLSAALDTACTGAGESITVAVTVNGTELVSGPEASLTTNGAETAASATSVPGTFQFAAGDAIGVSYTSTAITNTPKLVAT
ncbi:MAG: hypothetical protein OER92_04900, partial [Alphaproteobacteria bacterium]|nr:hypothetical protein [Alphaproteobacteria bacterium]